MSDLSVKLKPEVLGKSELAILASFEDLHMAMRDVKMSERLRNWTSVEDSFC